MYLISFFGRILMIITEKIQTMAVCNSEINRHQSLWTEITTLLKWLKLLKYFQPMIKKIQKCIYIKKYLFKHKMIQNNLSQYTFHLSLLWHRTWSSCLIFVFDQKLLFREGLKRDKPICDGSRGCSKSTKTSRFKISCMYTEVDLNRICCYS